MKWFYIIILAFLASSCNKDKGGAKNVTILFTEPQIGDTIPSWNQIHMEGTVSGDGEMCGYTLSAINKSTNETVFKTTYDVVSKAYNFHEHWINSLYDTTVITVRVEVLKDGEGNKEIKEIDVVCLP